MNLRSGTPLHVTLAFGPDEPVGRLVFDRGLAALEYAAEFIASGRSLNPLLPAPAAGVVWARDRHAFAGLHGMLADSLPDAWGDLLIKRRAERAGVPYASLTALDKLAIVGRRGMGALAYGPAIPDDATVANIDLDVLARASLEVLEGRDTDVLPVLERLGGSSGGARPKALVGIDRDGRMVAGDVDVPDEYAAWIVKFRSHRNDPEDIGPLEAAYADMARAAGVDVSETRLLARNGAGYFATRRFDRPRAGARLHVASVSGLIDAPWDSCAFSYEDLLKVVRAVTRSQPDVERMFRRMLFNILAHNRDDHVKQHSFLMDERGVWTLAPAYDLVFSHGPGNEHYLSVAGSAGDDIVAPSLVAAGVAQGISKRRCQEMLAEVADAVSDFPEYAHKYNVSLETSRAVSRAIEAGLRRLTGR
jgi:serine/threonine-protein kinase HipA